MPLFTKAEMTGHISRCGKTIAGLENHSVPTSLRKAKTFLDDEYLHEIMASSNENISTSAQNVIIVLEKMTLHTN